MEGAGAPYVAAFAFEGTEAGNLQIGLGEVVIVTDSSREDWWIGHRAGDPCNHGLEAEHDFLRAAVQEHLLQK